MNIFHSKPSTSKHRDIRAACEVLDCIMIEAERAGVTIKGADISTFESGSVYVHLSTDSGVMLAQIIGLGDAKYVEYTPSRRQVKTVLACYEKWIGRWRFSTSQAIGAVKTHGCLLDRED